MVDKKEKKILFFGDIVGKSGRNSVKEYLISQKDNADFIIANVENASHGFGLTKKNYDELSEVGINCMTSGNHIWDKKDIYDYIKESEKILRPINYPDKTAGKGVGIFELDGEKVAVINALGRVFMPLIDSPWEKVTEEINLLKNIGITSVFIDFHAEATAEKICFAKYLANEFNNEKHSIIKGFFGTHTHVQTADETIINGMAYITDAGFCGNSSGVIGMEYTTSLKRLSTGLPERFEIAQGETSQVNGVAVSINEHHAIHIERINFTVNNNEIEKEVNLETGG
ncbi:MAG: YmdB family metallophosphoesterase [bacterium]|nr:YmdB family metallophosphoesterase [bacterium]